MAPLKELFQVIIKMDEQVRHVLFNIDDCTQTHLKLPKGIIFLKSAALQLETAESQRQFELRDHNHRWIITFHVGSERVTCDSTSKARAIDARMHVICGQRVLAADKVHKYLENLNITHEKILPMRKYSRPGDSAKEVNVKVF